LHAFTNKTGLKCLKKPHLKDLLLMSWCQTPQDTFRGLVEPTPRGSKLFWQDF